MDMGDEHHIMERVRMPPMVQIGFLILGSVLLASCGASPHAASPSSSTSSTPPSSTLPTTTIPYPGPKITSISSVACVDALHCWAGAGVGTSGDDSAILASTDGGATWDVQDVIPGVDGIGPIACPSDTHCMAAADRVTSQEPPLLLATSDAGTTWSMPAMSSGVSTLDALSCVNDSDCWLVAEKPQGFDLVMATTDWGRTWSVQDQSSIEVSTGVGFGISCPSTSHCVIVGVGALTTTNGGSSWQKHTFPTGTSPPGELNVVACPSLSLCVAEQDISSAVPANTSTGIATSDDGGTNWRTVDTVKGAVSDSVSCPTTMVCLSVAGSIVETTTDGGRTWAESSVPDGASLGTVSCAVGTTNCTAVGTEVPPGASYGGSRSTGDVLKTDDDGSTWTEGSLPTG
jgi:photosystem II stability/assembly factor-like uncharacterized protein